MLCPVCENEPDNNQKCNTCGWEFIYFINKPTQMEKQNHELLLQNYRAEFWYMRALEYHENEYYQEAIQFCFKSCEKQMFENPLVLLALTYKILENNEQSLKYANMALEINSSNEIAHELLSEFNNPIQESKEIIKLTPEILDKSMFETTEEYQDRIRNLGYVEVGEVELKNYDADKRELQFNLDVKGFVEYKFDTSINLIYDKHIYTIIINPSDAQNLYSSKNPIITAKIAMKESNIVILDISVDKYSFYEEFKKLNEEDKQRKNEIKEKHKVLMQSFDNLPEIWFDEITNLEWQTKMSTDKTMGDFNPADTDIITQLKRHLNNIDNEITKTFLKKIELEYKAGTTSLLYRKKPDGLLKSVGKGLSSYIKSKI